MPFYNYALSAKGISRVVADTYAKLGRPATIKLLDDMKALGFKRATLAGISFGITDIRSPETKETISWTRARSRPTRSRRTIAWVPSRTRNVRAS